MGLLKQCEDYFLTGLEVQLPEMVGLTNNAFVLYTENETSVKAQLRLEIFYRLQLDPTKFV